jgi:hypothetical protein
MNFRIAHKRLLWGVKHVTQSCFASIQNNFHPCRGSTVDLETSSTLKFTFWWLLPQMNWLWLLYWASCALQRRYHVVVNFEKGGMSTNYPTNEIPLNHHHNNELFWSKVLETFVKHLILIFRLGNTYFTVAVENHTFLPSLFLFLKPFPSFI